jgi:hypothetical protein
MLEMMLKDVVLLEREGKEGLKNESPVVYADDIIYKSYFLFICFFMYKVLHLPQRKNEIKV